MNRNFDSSVLKYMYRSCCFLLLLLLLLLHRILLENSTICIRDKTIYYDHIL